jgi:integrase
VPSSSGPAFADVVEAFLIVNAPQWKVTSTEPRKYRLLKSSPFGQLKVDAVTVSDVEALLRPKPAATADKVRMRVLGVINYAIAKGWRPAGQNPAAKAIIKHLIASPPKSIPHAAMALGDLPAFYAELVADGSPAARSLALAILTGGRTAEARDMRREEISGSLWTIPGGNGERSMKEGEAHEVPLSPAALSLLGEPSVSGPVFGKLKHDALLDKIRKLRPTADATTHGMRAVFRTWVQDHTDFDWRVAEKSLSHVTGNATERAYARGQMMAKRTALLNAWSDYCTGAAGLPK